jgi:Na+/H+ antiporter NhaC
MFHTCRGGRGVRRWPRINLRKEPMTIPVDPGWLSLLPPLVAIALALATREVVLSLFAGIWLAALLLVDYNPVAATTMSLDTFILEPLTDGDHVAIVLFSLMLGGMVGVITKSGGAQGIVEVLRPFATTRRRGQFFTWLSGLMIFFDDYANTLIRGNTMRPMTDELRISREKLAYIVDSVAAPIAVIAPISTWVGFEISRIGDALSATAAQTTDPVLQQQLAAGAANPFNVFLHSIPYLFYPIFAMMLVLMIAFTGREFGPMREAETRAASGRGLYRPGARLAADVDGALAGAAPDVPRRWYNAMIPILVVVIVALIALYTTGRAALDGADPTIRNIIGEADPFRSLLWASFAGGLAAGVLAVAQRILTVKDALDAWVGGMRAMLLAMVILVLAWGLGAATGALGTGPYLAALLGDALPLWALPSLVFVIAAATAFATGTSWGTMAILFPVVVPLAVAMGAGVGFAGGDEYTILLGSISSIMAGAVFGDHASPISDTTVISSMASACDHIDHVRTQLPYALLAAAVALLVGDLPTAIWGINPAISILGGLAVLYGALMVFGRPIDVPDTPASAAPGDKAAAHPAG